MKIYIAGKITGEKNYRYHFAKAAFDLAQEGNIVLNPALLPKGLTNEEYMRIGMIMLECADAVVMLNNWKDSGGARVEYKYAKYLNKKILFETPSGKIISFS